MNTFADQLIDHIEGDEALLGDREGLLNAAMMLISLVLVNIHDGGYRAWLVERIADHVSELPVRLNIVDPSDTLH